MEAGEAVHQLWGSRLSTKEFIERHPEIVEYIIQGIRDRDIFATSHNRMSPERIEYLKRRNPGILQEYQILMRMYSDVRNARKMVLEELGRKYELRPLTIRGIIEHGR